jgi:Carboxypeptidase regulatory-like domain
VKRLLFVLAFCVFVFWTLPEAYGQFTGALSGTVLDPNGAVVPSASLRLTNTATGVTLTTKSDSHGEYHFNSLAPAAYQLNAQMTGFSEAQNMLTLETGQTLNFDVKLAVGSSTQTVQVTTQTPTIDTADTRLQETLGTQTLSSLPLAGRSMISLVTLAPGVAGLGVTSNGSPGSGRDNYSTETQVDASANGQGAVGNMYVVDGLDVTSSIRPGVLNMTPNPDTIQEASIQTNTYNVDYGRSSSIQMMMTTKSGTSGYHGNVSDYFTYQGLSAGTEFTHKYAPYHSNNISATIGGPIVPHHNAFFFFGIEPTLSSAGISENITFEDPQFTQFAITNYPNNLGAQLLAKYPVSKVNDVSVSSLASASYPAVCGTAASAFLPCTLPLIDSANYTDSAYRNGTQYMVRADKPFAADRLYGTYFRTSLNTSTPNPRQAFNATNNYTQFAVQVNESHTFSANTLNQASFAAIRVQGKQPAEGLFMVPAVNVTGIGQGIGSGFAQGDFIQHNYHWRDVLTHVYRSHNLSAGYEGLLGDDVEPQNGPYDQPTFQFNGLLQLAQNNIYTESGVAYDPLTSQHVEFFWNAAAITHGLFIQDTWKLKSNLTLNYGLRWDDYGNPYARSPETILANFYMGPGQTEQQQIANGFLVIHHRSLNRAITDIFSPRAGVAWDVKGNGKWLVKGGAGIFHNWPSLGNLNEGLRGNPPGAIFPTFYGNETPTPIFALGTSNQKPFGFPYPVLPPEQLDPKGGLQGLHVNIGALNPNLEAPISYIYSAGVERELPRNMVASFAYTGAQGRKLMSGGGQVYATSYGQDINALPGDLILHNSLVPTRLNTSFGEVLYTNNDRVSAYNAAIFALRGRFHNAFFNGSYTRSSSKDDSQLLPSYINPHQWYSPSNWDAPNRFSLGWNYEFPMVDGGLGLVGRAASGWQISGTAILQSGTPFTVSTNAPFSPLTNSTGQFTGYAPGSGDYNADGDNFDFPNVTSYKYQNSRKAYLTGVFGSTHATALANFPQPSTFGTEGNEAFNAFRGPGFAEWDTAFLKNTTIREGINFQLRFEFFNLFNRANLNTVDSNLPDGNFGQATSQYTPRFLQIGGNLTF